MNETLREITVKELSGMMTAGNQFTLLDVREEWELTYAQIRDEHVLNIPMSSIGRQLKEAFPTELQQPGAEIVVMCHHGVRSANVTMWMLQNGWLNVSSLSGGIAAYAQEIDPRVGEY